MFHRFLSKLCQSPSKALLIAKSLRQICRTGGFTTLKISVTAASSRLEGKRILITGGSSGIGLAIAKKCIAEGGRCLITGRDQLRLDLAAAEVNNDRLKTIVWDVSQTQDLTEKISSAKELLTGEIDILVNNAGVLSATSFPNVTEEDWDKVYSINSRGLFFLTQKLCRDWQPGLGVRKIINISSQGGFVGATYPYRMTKWDVAGLTQGLAIKLAPDGIIVNGIAPGIIATAMQPVHVKNKNNVYCGQNALKRCAIPEEIAELAAFLMSDAANFIVGQTIVCDGGYSIK